MQKITFKKEDLECRKVFFYQRHSLAILSMEI
nr:MAG TPA: hypothetical protein [Caudoviricetes sp.]